MLNVHRTFEAYIDRMNTITILVPKSYHRGKLKAFTIENPNHELCALRIHKETDLSTRMKYECRIDVPIEIGQHYLIYDEYGAFTDLQIGAVIRTKEFDEQFFYNGNDLGVIYTRQQTTFKLWAPTATEVKLKLLEPKTGKEEHIPLERTERGVWTVTVFRDIEGMHYNYLVCVNLVWREAVDPYAVAVSMNGEYGVIVDLTKTHIPKPSLPPLLSPTDAIIYEAHIRDFTIHPDSGIVHKGMYLGLTELGTTGPNNTVTGLSYIKELGITHVELLPFNDFAGVDEGQPNQQYNWGYNPLHYNVPEGSYATDPADPYARIYELKKAIRTLQENGIRVIMDVVYNHVYIREQSSFEKIVPGYYFRHDEHGLPSNGTGVGNDIASERKMVRKFIVDSIRFWMEEYHVDGFRFDLMGILDIETMKEICSVVHSIDPSALLLGEGWDLPTPLPSEQKATLQNADKLPDIAYFNDRFRDSIKGSAFSVADQGFVLGDCAYRERIKEMIAGSVRTGTGQGLFFAPTQTINYVESHDNHTFWDKMMIANGHESEAVRKKRQKLATAMVLLSQGIPFLHSGQEFYRTKQGIENSYNAPDEINQLDWKRKSEHEEDVRYIQGLIRLRNEHRAFRLATAAEIRAHLLFLEPMPPSIIAYQLHHVQAYGRWSDIIVIHHNQETKERVFLPDEDEWHVVCDGKRSGIDPLFSVQKEMEIDGVATFVLVKTGS
ncbi:type I pullulanase [Thermaerobacillus caldiproteolyticus]|uniref:Pullulanase n=1 Tax=Thermaerobacillus caldiproteolyticus TaxID=247480 RepID=A0A7V9Z4E6_9BACL|nr:type I pullulanase [Anoxybacillus caldiproteolyticus]MBA2873857.1 pullulanase [Anoxybacillus caldiproteolyticus]